MQRVDPPREFPAFQEELTKIAGPLGGLTPDGRPRLLLEWGGYAWRWFKRHKVAKYRRNHYTEQIGWLFAGDPNARLKAERRPFICGTLDPAEWPARYLKYRAPGVVNAIIVEPHARFYLSEWMSPQKASIDWDEQRYGAPPPSTGYYYPICEIGARETETNPFGYREPDAIDLEFARKYVKEKVETLIGMGVHADEPLGDSEITHINYWIERSVAHLEDENSARFKQDAREIMVDYILTGKRASTSGGKTAR
jgi:hypothetical protein